MEPESDTASGDSWANRNFPFMLRMLISELSGSAVMTGGCPVSRRLTGTVLRALPSWPVARLIARESATYNPDSLNLATGRDPVRVGPTLPRMPTKSVEMLNSCSNAARLKTNRLDGSMLNSTTPPSLRVTSILMPLTGFSTGVSSWAILVTPLPPEAGAKTSIENVAVALWDPSLTVNVTMKAPSVTKVWLMDAPVPPGCPSPKFQV